MSKRNVKGKTALKRKEPDANVVVAAAQDVMDVAKPVTKGEPLVGHAPETLDEMSEMVKRFVGASPEQHDAMVLYAAATHAAHKFDAFGRIMYRGASNSGKTTALNVTCNLSSIATPMGSKGFGLKNIFINLGEDAPKPTLYVDEVQDKYKFENISRHLVEGYKKSSAMQGSDIRGIYTKYSIFTPMIMAGKVFPPIPDDVKGRTIMIDINLCPNKIQFGVTDEYSAKLMGQVVKETVVSHLDAICRFKVQGLVPLLDGRKLEIWGPLIAVAAVIGGQSWLNRAIAAFDKLGLEDADRKTLSPKQQYIWDALNIAKDNSVDTKDGRFCGTMFISERLSNSQKIYGNNLDSISNLLKTYVRSTGVKLSNLQRTFRDGTCRGLLLSELETAWNVVDKKVQASVTMENQNLTDDEAEGIEE